MNAARPIRSVAVAIALVVSALTLAGCATSVSPYSDVNRAAQPSDQLPDAVAADADIDAESARLVGEYQGTRVWVSLGASEDSACLVIVPTAGDTQVACDIAGHEISLSEGSAVKYLLVPGRGEAPDGDHIRLSENVYVVAK